MNKQLLEFIELCLVDGVVSDKEREIIFRKSKDLGVPKDECEVILEGMMGKKNIKTSYFSQDEKKNKSDYETIETVSFDVDLINFYNTKLKSLDNRLNYIMNNLEKDNILFREWLSGIDKNITRENKNESDLWYDESLMKQRGIERDKYVYFLDYSPKDNEFKKRQIGYFNKVGLENIKNINQIGLNEKIIGKIDSYNNVFLRIDYLITDTCLYPIVKKNISGWFSGNYIEETLDTTNKINICDIDLNKKEHYSILFHFIVVYFNHNNEFSFVNDFLNFRTDFTWESLTNTINVKNQDQFDLILGLTNNIYNLQKELNTFCDDIVNRELDNDPYSHLRFVGTQRYSRLKFKISENFINHCKNLVTKVKLIVTTIILRNKLIDYSLSDQNEKFNELKHKLDSLGVLMNYFESNSLKELKNISDKISNQNKLLDDLIETISIELSSGLNEIKGEIRGLNDQVQVGNIISIINLYQTYRINKKLN